MGCVTNDDYSVDRVPNDLPTYSNSNVDSSELNSEVYNATLKKTAILDLGNGYSAKVLDINRKEEWMWISFRKDGKEYSTQNISLDQTYDVKDQNDQNIVYSIHLDKIYDNSFVVELTYILRPEISLQVIPIEKIESEVKFKLNRDTITANYTWEYDNQEFWINFEYNEDAYEAYSQRSRYRDFDHFVTDPYDDELISQITTQLTNMANSGGYDSNEIPYIAMTFVQALPYISDSASAGYDEYPRYPFETLYHGGGDCEDSSILLAAILYDMGYGVALIELPGHMAVGVKGDENIYGHHYDYAGSKYFYLETTNSGWDVGVIPDGYIGAKALIIPIYSGYPELRMEFTGSSKRDYYYTYVDLNIKLENIGSANAEDVIIYTSLETTDDGRVWDQIKSDTISSIGADESFTYTVSNLKAPIGKWYRVGIWAVSANSNPEYIYSDWVTA
ncbi:MAG: hypothetical protein M8350_08015 [Methanosarcinaceae archaeon]|nr:hypothetical protein [Methanosarcinaceae archaeon]